MAVNQHPTKEGNDAEDGPSSPSNDAQQTQASGQRKTIAEGEKLDDFFDMGELIETENHAQVYSVIQRHVSPAIPAGQYEARIFDLRDLSPSYRKYRLRSMKRLANRTVLYFVWGEFRVLIYKVDEGYSFNPKEAKVPNQDAECQPMPSTTSALLSVKPAEPATKKPRSAAQQESRRLRQIDRRRENRRRKQNDGTEAAPLTSDINEKDMYMFAILHLAQAVGSDQLGQLSPGALKAIENYKAASNTKVVLKTEDELVRFIDLKEREVVSLSRQQHKYEPVLKQLHAQLTDALRLQMTYPKFSSTWKEIQTGQVDPLKLKHLALKRGLAILPGVIKAAHEAVESSKKELELDRRARQEEEARVAFETKRAELKTHVENYSTWISTVVPGSETYAHVTEKIETAQAALKKLELGT